MCIRICLGFRDLVGMTLRDFKYQPHVTGGSKCLKNILQHDIATCFLVLKYFFRNLSKLVLSGLSHVGVLTTGNTYYAVIPEPPVDKL